ncbi:AAA family ATPase [Nonomuraea sp. NBC_00507]|uniref:helix-turn-helix transcriptional regulator n=1 Tax=Nonomuraea sp. NBC_00507 TaxID=2976002 RepID=UPI002E19F2CE
MLYGREKEQGEIDRLLGRIRSGESGALHIWGEPGIGKSALLEYAASRSDRARVLRIAGVESEAELPYAALHLLLRPALHRMDALAEPQADALRGALGLTGAVGADRFLIGLAALTLLDELAGDGPLLCLVDDAHWLDGPSAETMVFVARRLQHEGIALIFGARPGFAAPGVTELKLGDLDRESASLILDTQAPRLPWHLRDRVLAEAEGNPLALLELQHLATGPTTLPTGRLPLPQRIQDAYQRRIGELSHPAQAVLTIAAAEETGALDVILRTADALGVVDGLDEAEAAGLIRIIGPVVTFRHPLVRTAAYQGTPFSRRLAIHRALAAVLDGERDADRHAWHLAAASPGPDESVAAALESAAGRARERSGYAAAASALARAAQLSEGDTERGRRLLAATQAAALAGLAGLQESLAEQAERLLTDPYQRAALNSVRAEHAFNMGSLHTAVDLLIKAAELTTPLPGALDKAAALLAQASLAAFYAGDPGLSRRVHHCFAQLAGAPGHPGFALVTATVDFLVGSLDKALPEFRARLTDPAAAQEHLAGYAIAAGHFGVARDLAAAQVEACRTTGRIGAAPMALAQLAAAELYLGRLEKGESAATEGLRMAEDTGQSHRVAHHHGVLAWIAAVRGEEERCREHAARNLGPFAVELVSISAGWGVWALAMLDLGYGRWEAVLDRLATAARGPIGHQVSAVCFAADEIEAAVRLGNADAAVVPFERLRRWAEAAALPWSDAVLARCRALLSLDDDPEAHFTAAVSCADRPFEQARSALVYGEWLRRSRRASDARTQLRHAAEAFTLLGATLWAGRAAAELRAAGETTPTRATGHDLVAQLTGQELQVVRLAATGATNKEIAAKLFLSPKTVGHHLYRAFPKLGVTTRTELARLQLA